MNLYKISLPPTLQDRVKCKSLFKYFRKNVVSFRFNLLIWLLEVSIFFKILIFFGFFYFFFSFILTVFFFFFKSLFIFFMLFFSCKYSYIFFLFFVGPFHVRSAQQGFTKFIDYAYTARYSKLAPFTGINI